MRYKARFTPATDDRSCGGYGEIDDRAIDVNPATLRITDADGNIVATLEEGQTVTIGSKVISFVEGSFEFEA